MPQGKNPVSDEPHSFGLMLGLAGTGYSLLRAGRPHQMPSVLAVEPPPDKVAHAPTMGINE